ncbi:dTDP-glucose 4,6-dehydratase [Sporosarcina sp. NPDC096371]|uniref:dTDP-glucose 4,6-dehydratase n=1 Tax=Sporosarcina sp. NPDC096371 TaxID=3364530 RepID=UPI0037F2F773
MNILVTGGAGFIGSNFIQHMLSSYDYTVINLDALTYAGNLSNLEEVAWRSNYHFVRGEIGDAQLVQELFERYDIDVVINFAAETHADQSMTNPARFLTTNVTGTQILLEAAKCYWQANPEDAACRRFIQISTDEVYGTVDEVGLISEETSLSPNSPYTASKASADLMVRAYYETYGLPILITRCSTNYGPYQFPEKFIPLMIENALQDKPLPLYGDGKQRRNWLHVHDHCLAIDAVLHKGEIGEVYNIGGSHEKENLEVVKLILKALRKSDCLIEFVENRLGQDKRCAIDYSKIEKELGWVPRYTFEQGLKLTIDWYLEHADWTGFREKRGDYGAYTH